MNEDEEEQKNGINQNCGRFLEIRCSHRQRGWVPYFRPLLKLSNGPGPKQFSRTCLFFVKNYFLHLHTCFLHLEYIKKSDSNIFFIFKLL